MRWTLSLVLLLLPLCAQTPQDAPKKAGPPAPKNLKILKPEDLRAGVMRQYTQALGVMCTHCHVQGDFAADDKPQKTTARMMIAMVAEINAKFPPVAGKTYVACYTCHNGKVTPLTAPPPAAPAQ
jgi:cytochrome c5